MGATRSWWRDPWVWGLALWGAALAALAFPPGPLGPLAAVAPAPLWVASVGAAPRRALARGWGYGLGFFSALLWWLVPTIVRYGSLPWVAGGASIGLLVGYLALAPALCALAVALAARRSCGAALLVAPLAWTALEALRGAAFGGFPWGDLPQALWQSDAALRLAPWVGVDGVRLLLGGLAVGPAWLALRLRQPRRTPPWAVLPALLAAGAWAGFHALPRVQRPEAGSLRVGVAQGNIDQAVKWDPAFRSATLDAYAGLTRAQAAQGAALVLWPETAVPAHVQDRNPERARLEHLARDLEVDLMFGAPAYSRGDAGVEYRNGVFWLGRDGRLVARYDKVHLVPFGEFVPLGRYLPFLKRLVAGAGDFSPGPGIEPFPNRAGLPAVGPLVCFEVIFPDIAAEHVRRGAQLLAVVTNDGWFGRTPGPYQHLAFAAWRAAELQVPLVRAANTGVSAAFDARGRLLRATPLMERDGFVVDLRFPAPGPTPQQTLRPWLSPACGALALCGLFAILRRPSAAPAPRGAAARRRSG